MLDWLTFGGVVALVVAFFKEARRFSYWQGHVDSDRKTTSELLKEIRQDIKGIFGKLSDPLVASASPVALTERGKQAARQLDAYAWAARVAQEQASQVTDKKEFEVYTFCQDDVDEFHVSG